MEDSKNILISDYQYNLPQDRIAVFPEQDRDKSRLLVYDKGEISESRFNQIESLLASGDCLVLNKTRVIKARLFFTNKKGSRIEIFCVAPGDKNLAMEIALNQRKTVDWYCMVGRASRWSTEESLEMQINNTSLVLKARLLGKEDDLFKIVFEWDDYEKTFGEIIQLAGNLPLPPYLKRESIKADDINYQTVFASESGSVAAPTAGLHFSSDLLDRLEKKGVGIVNVTLHVGAGTFLPVKVDKIGEHEMHREEIIITAEAIEKLSQCTGRIIAVGTTVMRTLESLYFAGVKTDQEQGAFDINIEQWEALNHHNNLPRFQVFRNIFQRMEEKNISSITGFTSLIITPGFQVRVCDVLITNFHQPGSTLLLLVAACIGSDWQKVYQYALDNNFRFLSFGDTSFLRINK